jgi:hypothetical protein
MTGVNTTKEIPMPMYTGIKPEKNIDRRTENAIEGMISFW